MDIQVLHGETPDDDMAKKGEDVIQLATNIQRVMRT